MGSDEPPAALRWNRPLRAYTHWFPALPGTPFRVLPISYATLLPLAVALVLAVGLAIVPAIGAGAEIATGVGHHSATGSDLQPSPQVIDSTGDSSTAVNGGAVSIVDGSEGSTSVIGAVVDSMSGGSVVLFGAYSRYDDGSPLEHPVRSEIDDVANRRPGVQFADVVRSVGRPAGTVRYHTRVLEREDHVQTETVWGSLRLFPSETDASDFEALAALRDDSRERILRAVDRDEPATVTALAEHVDRAPSTVSHHLSRLEEAALIERERNGQTVHVSLAQGVSDLLAAAENPDADPDDSTAVEFVGN